jgi:hypothetical protein
MSSFSITTPDTEITLRPTAVKVGESATGTTTYTVTNRSGQTIRTRLNLEAVTTDGTSAKWFAVKGEAERDIGPAQSETFTVEVSVPGASARAVPEEQRKKHTFRAIAVNLKDGDNDYERGSVVAFREPVLVEKKPLPWKWVAAAAALVVVTAGVTWALWPKEKPEDDRPLVVLANWEKHTLEEAEAALVAQGLNVEKENQNGLEPDPQQASFYQRVVLSQTPAATADPPTQIRTGETVKLLWNWDVKTVDVPDLTGKDLMAVNRLLREAGLQPGAIQAPSTARPNNLSFEAVVAQDPPHGKAPAFTPVAVRMDWKQSSRVVIFDHVKFQQQVAEVQKPVKKPMRPKRPTGVEIDGN